MATIPAHTALRSCDSLLSTAKEILQDAYGVANNGGLGETVVQLMGLSQAVTDVQAGVRARLAQKGGLS
jgi:hypothetical protein